MTPASRTASQWPVPAATVPLACSCDDLQRIHQRLQALAGRCDERFDQLQRAFEQLPAAAAFDPFAVAAPAPGAGAAMAAAPAPRSKGQARVPGDGLRPASSSAGAWGRVGAAGLAAVQAPRASIDGDGASIAGALAGAATGRSGLPSGMGTPAAASGEGPQHEPVNVEVASLTGWLGSLGTLAALGGEQVALLMQRHAAPPVAVGWGGAAAAAWAGQVERGQAPETQHRRESARPRVDSLGSIGAQGSQAAALTLPSGAAQRASALGGAGPAAGWSESFAAVGWAEAPTPSARLAGQADSALATAPQLLEQLLVQGLGGAVAGAFAEPAPRGQTARQPAVRAASRLVGPQSAAAADQARGPGPGAPAAASMDALDAGEAVAQQISRLLLDQAWMRGVDLR